MHIAIINGPNLNLIGTRETMIYGNQSLPAVMDFLKKEFSQIHIRDYQSNIEGELIDLLQQQMGKTDGIVLNAGAYSHTSIALRDAIKAISVPVIEVHISNVLAREAYRKNNYIAEACIGSISGLGTDGYRLAVDHLIRKLQSESA